MILTCFLAALLALRCRAAPHVDGLEVLVNSPVKVLIGHSATLPCWLNPPQSAEAFEVQWYRSDQQDSTVMVYKDQVIQPDGRNTTFEGRVSFGKKETTSPGLASGDVSLRLLNVTMGDAGKYTCYVSGDQDYDKATVTLSVSKTGGPVHLSAVWGENNMGNISCESEGWYPEPRLQWRDSRGNLLSPEIPPTSSRASSGLVSVHSWLLVPRSSKVSCSVALEGGEVKEASVNLDGPTPPVRNTPESQSDAGASVAGWVAFALLLITVVAAVGVLLFRRRATAKSKRLKKTSEEAELLLPQVIYPTDLKEPKKSHENITFARTENQYLKVKDSCIMRDSEVATPLTEVTCLTANTGSTGFSSGRHYWEVSMKSPNIEAKRSWWLGVTKNFPLQSDVAATVSNGFWFLSFASDHFHFNTVPQVSPSVPSRPETVGVYLDCDTGELSFYNVEEKSLIGSLSVPIGLELYPLFNTGLGDQSAMKLIHETKEDPDCIYSEAAVTEQQNSQ